MKESTFKVRIIRIANLYFGVEASAIEKVHEFQPAEGQQLPLNDAECKKHKSEKMNKDVITLFEALVSEVEGQDIAL
ncbi:MAG: hypothetical protein U5P10_01245 [Spirochaetia bacterium]|nr:hypothetical protein [Spirochaetia bacterium]